MLNEKKLQKQTNKARTRSGYNIIDKYEKYV